MKKMHYRYKKRYIFKWDVKKMFKKYLACIFELENKMFSVKNDKLILYCTVWQIFAILKKILLLGSKVRESCVSATPDYFQ